MLFKAYQLKSLINPSLKIWGIYCFVALASPLYAQESPKERLSKFFKRRIPDDMECLIRAGYDLRKLDSKCLQHYLATIENTGLFTSSYIKNKKILHEEILAMVAKLDTVNYLGGMLTEIHHTTDELEIALENSSSAKIDKNKTIVTINLKRPYPHKLLYNFDLEENQWKVSSIEFKE